VSAEPEHPHICTEPRAESERSRALLIDGGAEQGADIEEERHRQRELDDAELGGEA
jgi:hypothetical protein